MRLRVPEVFADVGAMWHGAREVLLPVAAIFFFLPWFAVLLFLPVLDLTGLDGWARIDAQLNYMLQQSPWLIAQFIVESLGVGTLLLLLLDPARLSVGEALARALRLLPGLAAARLIASAAVMLGLSLLVLPGLFLMARTFLTSARYIDQPQRGPAGAAVSGFELTAGNGWPLFVMVFMAWTISNLLGGSVAAQIALSAEPLGPFVSAPLKGLTAAIVTAGMLLAVLLEAASYRALSAPKQGI